MQNKNRPGFLLETQLYGKKSSNNTGGYKSPSEIRSESLDVFQMRFRETNPLLIRAMNKNGRKSSKDKLAELVKFQKEAMIRVSKNLGYSNVDLIPENSRFMLSRSISESILDCDSLRGFKNSLNYVSKLVSSCISEEVNSGLLDFGGQEQLISSDAVINLKISTIKPSMDFSRVLYCIGASESKINEILKQQFIIASSMAKDICFNHDKKASLWDREKLFISLIEPCMHSVFDSWVNLFVQKSVDTKNPIDISKIEAHLSKTKESILENEMGHNDVVDSTLSEIGRFVAGLIDSPKPGLIPKKLKKSYLLNQITIIDQKIANAWNEASESIQDEVSNLSEKELERWIENEGSKPMPLSRVWELLDEGEIEQDISNSEAFNIDYGELAGQSFYRLIQAWGLTDTLCQKKS